MAKELITEEEYNDKVDKITELERELRAKDDAIRQLSAVVQEKKDESWFQREIDGEKKKTAKAEARVKTLEANIAKEKLERSINQADAAKIEQARIDEIRANTLVSQNEHTRFRLLERAPSGQRDLFGDPSTPVFDAGIEFHGYYGGVYLPVSMVIEIAQSIGMLTAEDSNSLKDHSLVSEKKANVAPSAAKELQDGITRLISEFNSELDSVVLDVPVGDEESDGDESKSTETAGQADSSESNTDS